MWYVYMVRCNDNTLYTGITNDLEKRIIDHNTSKAWAKYTKGRRPVKLVRSKKVKDKSMAAKREYAIKQMKKSEKELLVKEWTRKK